MTSALVRTSPVHSLTGLIDTFEDYVESAAGIEVADLSPAELASHLQALSRVSSLHSRIELLLMLEIAGVSRPRSAIDSLSSWAVRARRRY